MSVLTGQCLCGACRLSAAPKGDASACHCGMCRKWTGGVFIAVGSETPVTFNDDAPLGVYRGSEWGERVFCKTCGSSLLWRSQDGAYQHVSVQVFDDPARFALATEIFIDCKPASYEFANETHKMTEAEVMAAFGAQS